MPEFWARITGKEGERYLEALGSDVVPIRDPRPAPRVELEEGRELAVYFLDLSRLNSAEIEALARMLARRYALDEAAMLEDIERHGVPVLADDCVVITKKPERRRIA